MVLAIHDEALAAFGGLAGVRDAGLLDSALDRSRNETPAVKPRRQSDKRGNTFDVSRTFRYRGS